MAAVKRIVRTALGLSESIVLGNAERSIDPLREFDATVGPHLLGFASRASAGFADDFAESDAEVVAVKQSRQLLLLALRYRFALEATVRLLDSHAAMPGRVELTARQQEVLRLVSDGASNRRIARQLGISERTVRKHLDDIRHRLNLTNRTAAARWWLERSKLH